MVTQGAGGRILQRAGSCSVCAGCLTAVLWLAGCQQEKPAGYHTFRESERDLSPTAKSSETSDGESEPMLPDVEADDDESPLTWHIPASALEPLNVVDGSSVADIVRIVPSGAEPPAAAGDTPTGPRQVQLLVKQRDFRRDGASQTLRVTYDDLDLLKILNMDPVTANAAELMPDWLRKLDGQEVRIRGFMRPTFESTGLEQFVMARDAAMCCFGANPKVYDLIAVEMKPGTTCDYIHLRPFDVVGRFKIDPLADGNKLLALYWIEDAKIVQK
jgi:hypothetical protein